MINKKIVQEKIVKYLIQNGYDICITNGCFDVVAKKDKTMLIKSLTNIDSISKNQAINLRILSYFLSAYPFLVSLRNTRNFLKDNIIYSRFEIPVVTPKMFGDILQEEAYHAKSAKGRHSVEIDVDLLKEKRYDMNFTLKELSDIIGISKKALYEIENERTNPSRQTADSLEHILNVGLKKIYKPKKTDPGYIEPRNRFQKMIKNELGRIGIDNSFLSSAPFDIVGKGNYKFVGSVSVSSKGATKSIGEIKKLSKFLHTIPFVIIKSKVRKRISGMPVVLEEELYTFETEEELMESVEDDMGV